MRVFFGVLREVDFTFTKIGTYINAYISQKMIVFSRFIIHKILELFSGHKDNLQQVNKE